MKAHQENALKVAQFLESHPQVKHMIYPGLPSHPQHELAKRQMRNFSGMIGFQTKDAQVVAQAFAQRLQVIHYAVSFGHQRSLIYYISTQQMLKTSFALDETQAEAYRNFAGDGVFRLSVGLEDAEDLCRDLDQTMSIVEE
jgi:methionine-gamma-lyase